MFHSNQRIDISVEFRDLAYIIKCLMKLYGDEMFLRPNGTVHVAFTEPMTGVYAIGTGSMDNWHDQTHNISGHNTPSGWTDYQFDYDPEIIAKVIEQWARKQTPPTEINTDGSQHLGIRVRSLQSLQQSIPNLCRDYNIDKWSPFQTILTFTPENIVYHK